MKNSINYYRNLLITAYTEKNPAYNPARDSGLNGKALELAIKDHYGKKLTVGRQGKTDLRIGSRNADVKSGASDLGNVNDRLIKGSGLVVFVPVPLMDYDITMQEGYVMDRADFLAALESVGALRDKTMTDGTTHKTLQTFWNAKQNKAHGRLLDKMLTAFEEYGARDMVEMLEEYGVN